MTVRPGKGENSNAAPPGSGSRSGGGAAREIDDTTCPRCGESQDLAKVKGCIKCMKCHFKFDCNGW